MIKTFVAMPCLMKNYDVGGLVDSTLMRLTESDGQERTAGFSAKAYLEEHPALGLIDRRARRSPQLVKEAYWQVAMAWCLRKLREHDEVLGLVPLPASVEQRTFTVGLATELAYATSNQMRVHVADFRLDDLKVRDVYSPRSLGEVVDRYGLSVPDSWMQKSRHVRIVNLPTDFIVERRLEDH